MQPRVVRDVARRLLEVRHQPAPLEDLREQVRRLLAREVHAAELRDGVVAVLEEHARRRALRRACRPTVASTVRSPVRSRSPTNSSRNRRRRLLSEREYRANSAPFTTSGRFVSANTGPSRFVKYGRSVAASSSVKRLRRVQHGDGDGRRAPSPGLADPATPEFASDEQAVGLPDRTRSRRPGSTRRGRADAVDLERRPAASARSRPRGAVRVRDARDAGGGSPVASRRRIARRSPGRSA